VNVQLDSGKFLLAPESTVAIRHKALWGLATVKGSFGTLDGSGEVLGDGTANGVIKLHASSIDTRHGKRDSRLRSPAFFAADSFPLIQFDVLSASPAERGTVDVEGRLTIRGVTRPIALQATITAVEREAVTLSAQFPVDRARFGMTWNQLGMLRGPATITAKLHFTRVTD
jgi:polyisoprenoid-binding protein YceI